MQCQQEQNLTDCPCSYPDCPRKGKCCECVMHHRRKGEIPACFFPANSEEDYDRSLNAFLRAVQKK